MRWTALIALSLLAACSQQSADERGFAYTAAVEPQGSAPVQRIALPIAALVAIKRDDLGDVRLLDARGKSLPLARLDQTGAEAVTRRKVPLYPVAAGSPGAAAAGVSIAVAQPGQTVSIEANGSAAQVGMAAAIIDSRALNEPAVGLDLDLDLPAQAPVSFTLEASADLKVWDLLAEKVLFSPSLGQPPLGGARIALPGSDLEQRYLRLSWKAVAGVKLRGAFVDTAKTAPAPPLPLTTRGAALDNAHHLRLAVPTPAPLAGIELAGTRADGLIPLRLYGRDAPEQAWQSLGAATLRGDGRTARFDLTGAALRQYKVEADRRSAGFSQAPAVTLQVRPLTVLAAFNGEAPYSLVAGNAAAESKYFAPADLAEARVLAGELPLAKVAPSPPPVIDLGPGAADTPFAPRKLMLWGALLLATAVLAWGAIRMLRANAAGAGDQSAS